MGLIDAHCHVWSLQRGDYGWLRGDDPDLARIYRDFAPDDLRAEGSGSQRKRFVVVQAAPTDAETDFLLSLAEHNPHIEAVVGWVDLSSAEAAGRIAQLAGYPKLKGLRPMLQDLAQDDWIATAPRRDAIGAMHDAGLRFDALVLPRHLVPLGHFVERYPHLPVIIDHAAKRPLAAGDGDDRHALWRSGMKTLASFDHVHCKLSGLLTEMHPDQYHDVETALQVLKPMFADLLAWFGPQRLVWGSDWPVLTLAQSYSFWAEVTDRLLADLGPGDRQAILGENAERFYGLKGTDA